MSGIRRADSVLALVACTVIMQACVVAPERSARALAENNRNNVQTSAELDSLKEGDIADFRTGLLAQFGTITIGRQYDAASGRRCKQILDASGAKLLSVACQMPTQQWYIRDSLHIPVNAIQPQSGNGNSNQVLMPADPLTLVSKPETKDTQEPIIYKLEKGETLYSFARRTTGNASNWEEIAQYNGIKNEFELIPGTALKIPSSLQNAER